MENACYCESIIVVFVSQPIWKMFLFLATILYYINLRSSADSMGTLYWLRLLETGGLLTFLSLTTLVSIPLATTPVLTEPGGAVLAVRGGAERNPVGGRTAAGRLGTGSGPSDTELDRADFGFWSARPGRSVTDLDRLFVALSTLRLSTLAVEGLAVGFCSPSLAATLDFHIDPILDWTTLPLYIPGVGLMCCWGSGGFAASIIFLCFTACSVRKALLRVCRLLVLPAGIALAFFCTVLDVFNVCMSPCLESPRLFNCVSMLFMCRGTAGTVFEPFLADLLP